MKLSDYVIDFFAKEGVTHAFLVSGGAVIHLVDSVSKRPDMECVCVQHEQNGAASADMYARATGSIGLALSTSGPGASNMTTSICNAYFDSVPLVCVTGQVSRPRLRKTPLLRQRGFQETDVVSIFQSITKYAVLVKNPQDIQYELEKALFLAKSGRPGPVVVDIPDDVQREEIDPTKLRHFVPPVEENQRRHLQAQVDQLFDMLKQAERPVAILGAGVHAAKAEEACREFIERLHIPAVLTWGGCDLLMEDHPNNIGRVGLCGPRGGNFSVQNSDLVIAIGTKLSQMVTGGKQNLFALNAKKIMVDIDPYELQKFDEETFVLDLPICCDLIDFFDCTIEKEKDKDFSHWLSITYRWKKEFEGEGIETDPEAKVNPLFFIKELSKHAPEKSIIVGDTGANLSWTCQAWEFKKGQRIHSAWNHTPMGYALPASIGAAFGSENPIFCLIGDGGLMMCVEELATLKRYNLPIHLFVFNNAGHSIQKQTIEIWLQGRYTAVDFASGLFFPDYEKLAAAFGLDYLAIKTNSDLENIPSILCTSKPYLCDVQIDPNARITPMLRFGKGLEDLHPPLSDERINRIAEEAKTTNPLGQK